MACQNRHILVLIDNTPSHVFEPNLYPNLTVEFLEPNMTLHIQPMDAGIIKSFKSNYRRLLNEHAINLDTKGVANPYKVNQLQSMRMLTRAWEEVSETTIQNCWRHTGILPERDTEDELRAMFSRAKL